MTPRRFGSKKPSKASHRVAVQMVALMNDSPLTPERLVSLSRSHGLTVREIEGIFFEARESRA